MAETILSLVGCKVNSRNTMLQGNLEGMCTCM